jgi:Bacterial PH domain
VAELKKYLIAAETPVVVTRRHWASLIKPAGIGVLVLMLGLLLLDFGGDSQAASELGVAVTLAALGWLAWTWGQWSHERFIITDRRVLLVYGLLTQRVGVMPLSKVTDLTYERTLGGRLLGYGAFVVESAGQHQAFNRIDYLPTPDKLYHDVSVLLFRDRNFIRYRPYEHSDEHRTTPYPDDRWR